MFKNISLILEKKKKKIIKSSDSNTAILQAVKSFYISHISKDLNPEIQYNHIEGELVIQTRNKIIASEISLRLPDLYELLKKEKIQIKRILVR